MMRPSPSTQTKQSSPNRLASSSSFRANPSAEPLGNAQNNYMMMRTLETSGDQLFQQKEMYKQFKSDALDRMAKEDYQPAKYAKAVLYRNDRSYLKKVENSYNEIELLADTDELRYFGLGTYFYIQFFRRLCWLFLVMSLIQAITIYINYKGTGLDNYSLSFSSYLIKTTIGNYSGSVLTNNYDGYIVSLAPVASYLAMFIFYLIWKIHFFRTISAQEEDRVDVKPQKFCVEFQGLPQDYVSEEQLIRLFSAFGPVYEVSIVRRYDNKLPYFEQLDELEEQIKEGQLQLVLGGDESDRKKIQKKKAEKAKLEQQLKDMHIRPFTISAFVHFQFQKSKIECLNYFNDHYLFNRCSHSCMRSCCCCCVNDPDQRAIFRDKPLLVGTANPPTPEDINWQSFQLGWCSKMFRVFFAFLIILIFLALSCTIIGLCSLYISSHSSDCDGIDTTSYTATTAAATNSPTILRCYCNANLVQSFTDSGIKSTCSNYLTDIYIEQVIQYVVLITSAITNVLFGLIVNKLINCTRPTSRGSGLFLKTAISTIFMAINSILIPVLIYANIFGFQASNYVSFLTIISADIANFLQVTSLSFYPNFTTVWYRNVCPLFTNYVIFNTVAVWAHYIFFKCCCSSKDSLSKDQHKILQKTMNKKITDFKLDVGNELSNLYLIVIMASLFCAGIPAMIPLAFVNILSRYITNRSLLQAHSSKIEGLDEDFNSLSFLVFPFILIFFPLMGEWMLVANSSIYPFGLPTNFTFLSFLGGNFYELDLQIYLPFYLLISIAALGQFVIYYSVVKFCACVCSLCYEKKEVRYHTRPFAQYTKSLNIICSYNIRNNDEMRNCILHLEKYLIQNEK